MIDSTQLLLAIIPVAIIVYIFLARLSLDKRRLYLTISKSFQHSATITKDESIFEINVYNKGREIENGIKIILPKDYRCDLITASDSEVNVEGNKISIEQLEKSHSIKILIKVNNHILCRDNIKKFTSNDADGEVVDKEESMISTGIGLFGWGFLVVIFVIVILVVNSIILSYKELDAARGTIKNTSGDIDIEDKFKINDKRFLEVAKRSGCLACHAITKKVVGPAWFDVAIRYRNKEGALGELVQKVKVGGKGNWTDVTGGVPMPPYSPRVSDKDIVYLVTGILKLTED